VSDTPDAPAAAPPSVVENRSTNAGRGVLYIAFAKFYFMIAGLVVQIGVLPNVLSDAAWGGFSLVNSLVSWINNVFVTGTIQTVSQFAAQDPEQARRVQQAGLRMHVWVGLPFTIAFIAAAPLVAWLLHDMEKTTPLMLAGLIVGGYAFYSVFVGTANGLRQFHRQAGLDIMFATLRSIGLVGAAVAGLGVIGVVAGWVGAVGVIVVVAVAWIGLPGRIERADRIAARPMIRFFLGVAVYLVMFNLLMSVDTWLVKRLTAEYFAAHSNELGAAIDRVMPWAHGATGYNVDPSVLADVQVGYYTKVQQLARLPYQAIIAVTFVVFPLLSHSTFAGDREATRRYISVATRYSFVFAMVIAVVMAANPVDVASLVYGTESGSRGGMALALLAIGNVAFSLFSIAGTILNAGKFTGSAIVTAAIPLVLAIVGNYIAIPIAAERGDVLSTAAAVTGGAMLVGAIASGIMVQRRLGAFIGVLSIVRVAVATAVALAVGYVLPLHGKLMTLVEAAIVAAVFVATLVGTRELGKRDLEAIKAVRKKAPQGEVT
jgi:O-antigen/teichoic acid export membrane protein